MTPCECAVQPFGLGRMFGLGASISAATPKQNSKQQAVQQQRLNMTDSTRVLGNSDAILALKKESVGRLARLLNLKEAAAVLLLMQQRWQAEAAAEAYTLDPIGACAFYTNFGCMLNNCVAVPAQSGFKPSALRLKLSPIFSVL